MLPALLEQYGNRVTKPRSAWRGDTMEFSFQAEGYNIKGTLSVTDTEIVLDARLPFFARLFEGTVRSAIEDIMDRTLSAGANGQ